MNRINERSSNNTSYKADGGEPDAGYIPGGEVRSLGMEQGRPEPWYDKLEFTQVSFPQADYIFGTKRNDNKFVRQVSVRDLISEHEELKRQYRKIR